MSDWLLQGFNGSAIACGHEEVKNRSPLFDMADTGGGGGGGGHTGGGSRPSLVENLLAALFDAKQQLQQQHAHGKEGHAGDRQLTICLSLWSLRGNDITE